MFTFCIDCTIQMQLLNDFPGNPITKRINLRPSDKSSPKTQPGNLHLLLMKQLLISTPIRDQSKVNGVLNARN